MSDLPDFGGNTAAPAAVTASAGVPAAARATETFTVPVPTYVTPSLTAPLGPLVPEEIDPEATASERAATTPSAPAAPAVPAPPAAAPTSAAAAPPNQVRNVNLGCSQNKDRIVATLSFYTAEQIAVTLTAGAQSETSNRRGVVRMRVAGPAGQSPTCSAVVDGRQIGPIRR